MDSDKKIKGCFIHPESSFARVWGVIILISLIYVGSFMPLNLSFYSYDEYEVETVWFKIDALIDLVFITDIVINSFMAFYD